MSIYLEIRKVRIIPRRFITYLCSFVGCYYDWKEENDRIKQAIIKEEKAESFKEGIIEKQKEVVLNMYNKNFELEDISSITNLTLEEVVTIINNSNK